MPPRPARLRRRPRPGLVLGLLAGCGPGPVAPGAAAPVRGVAPVLADCDSPFVRHFDADGDGHGDPRMPVSLCAETPGFVAADDDCDPLRADVSPSSTEVCGDGLDNDCSGGDEDCAPPALATDALSLVSDDTTAAFGVHLAPGLDLSGDGVAELLVGDGGHDGERGHGWLVQPAALVGGTADTLDTGGATLADIAGDNGVETRLGQAVASGWTDRLDGLRDTALLATAGPLDIGGNDVETAIFLFASNPGLEAETPDADLVLLGAPVDPTFSYNGIESLAAGRWQPGTGDQGVISAAWPTRSRIVLVPTGGLTGDASLAAVGVPLAHTDTAIDLGQGLHHADLDGDGLDELVVGAPGFDRDGSTEDGGALWIVTGDTLAGLPPSGTESLLDTVGVRIAHDGADRGMGHRVDSLEMDEDGLPELILGAFEENGGQPGRVGLLDVDGLAALPAGTAHLDTALPGGVRMVTVAGDEPFDYAGFSVAGLAGPQPRVAIGAPGRDGTGADDTIDGAIWILDVDGTILDGSHEELGDLGALLLPTDQPGDGLGTGMASAGDLDEDGEDELWISALGLTAPGRVALLLRTGS